MRPAFAFLLVVTACKGNPSDPTKPTVGSAADSDLRVSLQALCDVPDHVPDGATPEERIAGAAAWLAAHAKVKDVLGFRIADPADKDRFARAVTDAGIARCKLLDNGYELQSLHDGVQLACDVPATASFGERAKWMRARLLNTEAARTFAKLSRVSLESQAEILHDLVARAGLASCALIDAKRQPAGAP